MVSTLFHIPSRLGNAESGLPLFGFGLLLVLWAVITVAAMAWATRRDGLLLRVACCFRSC